MSEVSNSMGMMDSQPSGFSFDNFERNGMIMSMMENQQAAGNGNKGYLPQAKKTGTTICGIIYKDGVVLGADTRATAGQEVVEKDCEKIHKIAENIWCCGAGTAADTQYTTELTASQLEILRMETHATTNPLDLRVVAALTRLKRLLFRYQGHISAALILGGVDNVLGPQLYSIHPHGSTGRFVYTAMGSGSLAAMAILEHAWRPEMNEEEAVTLVKRAISAGIYNDLGSGSTISINVLRADGTVDYKRRAETPNLLQPYRDAINRSSRLTVAPGTTPVLQTSFTPHKATLADVTITTESMEE